MLAHSWAYLGQTRFLQVDTWPWGIGWVTAGQALCAGPEGCHLPCRTGQHRNSCCCSGLSGTKRLWKAQWDVNNIALNFENLSWLFFPRLVLALTAAWGLQVLPCSLHRCQLRGVPQRHCAWPSVLSNCKWVFLSLRVWFYYWTDLI